MKIVRDPEDLYSVHLRGEPSDGFFVVVYGSSKVTPSDPSSCKLMSQKDALLQVNPRCKLWLAPSTALHRIAFKPSIRMKSIFGFIGSVTFWEVRVEPIFIKGKHRLRPIIFSEGVVYSPTHKNWSIIEEEGDVLPWGLGVSSYLFVIGDQTWGQLLNQIKGALRGIPEGIPSNTKVRKKAWVRGNVQMSPSRGLNGI